MSTAAANPKKVEFNEDLFKSLHTKLLSEGHSDEEHAQYLEQNDLKRNAEKADRNKLDSVVKTIIDSGYGFSRIYKAVIAKNDGLKAEVGSLFSPSEISAAAKVKVSAKAGKGSRGESTKTVLISYKAGETKPSVMQKGDKLTTYSKPAFKALSNEHGAKFSEKLKEFYTPAGKEYFALPEGKKELDDFIVHTQTKPDGPVKKKAVPAKKA